MLEEPHGNALMNFVYITSNLGILQEDYNRHGIRAGEESDPHMHGSLLGHISQLVRDIIVVLGGVLDKPVLSVIDSIGK